jgi:hypothetical protein
LAAKRSTQEAQKHQTIEHARRGEALHALKEAGAAYQHWLEKRRKAAPQQ